MITYIKQQIPSKCQAMYMLRISYLGFPIGYVSYGSSGFTSVSIRKRMVCIDIIPLGQTNAISQHLRSYFSRMMSVWDINTHMYSSRMISAFYGKNLLGIATWAGLLSSFLRTFVRKLGRNTDVKNIIILPCSLDFPMNEICQHMRELFLFLMSLHLL